MGVLSDWLFGKPDEGWKHADGSDVKPTTHDETNEAYTTPSEDLTPGESHPEDVETPVAATTDPYRDASGYKIVPDIAVTGVRTKTSDDLKSLELWLRFQNNSELPVELTTLTLLKHTEHLYNHLESGRSEENEVYSGKTPTTNTVTTAELQFKIVGSGDFFQTTYTVHYDLEKRPHGTFYIPVRFTRRAPTRDI